MDELQIFNYNEKEIRTVQKNGEPWWVLKDVCDVLSLTNPTVIADRLDDDERSKFDLGRQGKTNIINESGLYNVILRSDKPEAKQFKRWITHKVLPEIRRTGAYSCKNMSEYQKMMIQTRSENAKIRKAQILTRLAEQYDGTFKQVLQSHATKELTGEHLLPLPVLGQRTYTATELGEILGVSANKIGILTNRHNLKTEQYGQWFNDKAKNHSKEVSTFRYYESVIPILRELIAEQV